MSHFSGIGSASWDEAQKAMLECGIPQGLAESIYSWCRISFVDGFNRFANGGYSIERSGSGRVIAKVTTVEGWNLALADKIQCNFLPYDAVLWLKPSGASIDGKDWNSKDKRWQ